MTRTRAGSRPAPRRSDALSDAGGLLPVAELHELPLDQEEDAVEVAPFMHEVDLVRRYDEHRAELVTADPGGVVLPELLEVRTGDRLLVLPPAARERNASLTMMNALTAA